MPRLISEITELTTALGTTGAADVADALAAPPPALVDLDEGAWLRLTEAWSERRHTAAFLAAFANGRALLAAGDGLRGRPPARIEWKGPHRAPTDDPTPVDLRLDHVYLVSCKYLSKILWNSSPAQLFDRLLATGRSGTDPDWFETVAAPELQHLYQAVVRHHAPTGGLPARYRDVTVAQRADLRAAPTAWHPECVAAYERLCAAVSNASAERWAARLTSAAARRSMLWRLLRIGPAPYFVLGSTTSRSVRLRVATPWDWLRAYDLRAFEVAGDGVGQPRVSWQATARCRDTGDDVVVGGHVEIRWSHGRFSGPPEAKVYLDTPHHRVPGYFSLH